MTYTTKQIKFIHDKFEELKKKIDFELSFDELIDYIDAKRRFNNIRKENEGKHTEIDKEKIKNSQFLKNASIKVYDYCELLDSSLKLLNNVVEKELCDICELDEMLYHFTREDEEITDEISNFKAIYYDSPFKEAIIFYCDHDGIDEYTRIWDHIKLTGHDFKEIHDDIKQKIDVVEYKFIMDLNYFKHKEEILNFLNCCIESL